MSPQASTPVVGVLANYPAAAIVDVLVRSGARALHVPIDLDLTVDKPLSGFGALVVAPDRVDDEGGLNQALLNAALDADMVVLCISSGFYLLNQVLGGAAPRALEGHGPVEQDGKSGSAFHRIYIAPGTKLAAVVGSGGFVRVNSRHEGGLREADKSPRLLASAYSLDDGVIEALESPEHRWVIGVQFQPELRGELPPHFDRLFQSLVDRAMEYAGA